MTEWLFTVVVLVSSPMPNDNTPKVFTAEATIVETADECIELAKQARELLGGIGFVATYCDPISSMPFLKKRGTKI